MGEWQCVTDKFDEQTGGERWLKSIDDNCWISALYRRTGFGWMEWETAIVFIRDDTDPLKGKRGKWDDREVLIIAGDRRDELTDIPKGELRQWYQANIEGNKNSMETILDGIKEATRIAGDSDD